MSDGLHAARLSTRWLPPYRYVPGRAPHPEADPRGYAHGVAPPPVPAVTPAAWRKSEDYLYGCDLYNHGYWWEAHGAWEGLWHAVGRAGVQGRFLQGLIQVANAHLKWQMRRSKAVRALRASYRGHLGAVIDATQHDRFMGLAVAAWLAAVEAYYDGLAGTGHDAARYPYLHLPRSDGSRDQRR